MCLTNISLSKVKSVWDTLNININIILCFCNYQLSLKKPKCKRHLNCDVLLYLDLQWWKVISRSRVYSQGLLGVFAFSTGTRAAEQMDESPSQSLALSSFQRFYMSLLKKFNRNKFLKELYTVLCSLCWIEILPRIK